MNKQEAEKELDKFILMEERKHFAGSGDDMAYVLSTREYFAKQRAFWIDAIIVFYEMGKNGKKLDGRSHFQYFEDKHKEVREKKASSQ